MQRVVSSSGIAKRAGIKAGDELVSVNGNVILDFLDYQEYTAESNLRIVVWRDGKEKTLRVRKKEYQELGLEFESAMMSGMRLCCNHCIFCFVDQLPPNVRPSMCVKDDDWRMSLLTGSYVTLTNVSDREIGRIIARHASPLYISVHATDMALRSRLLGTPRAERLMGQLERLCAGGIRFHAQAVLCPNLNDGAALEKTIADLAEMIPHALSLALVPVGLTTCREGLYDLRPYTWEEARKVLDIAEAWRKRLYAEHGTRFVFPSDEFYLIAGREIPSDVEYEEYGQIDDGVGMLRLLQTEYGQAYAELDEARKGKSEAERYIAIACGKSPEVFLRTLMEEYPIRGCHVDVYGLENRFFGETVTVSGLITGKDLTEQMKDKHCEAVLITECMLRSEGDKFLDDMTLTEAREIMGKPLIPVGRRGEDLLEAILSVLDGVGK